MDGDEVFTAEGAASRALESTIDATSMKGVIRGMVGWIIEGLGTVCSLSADVARYSASQDVRRKLCHSWSYLFVLC